jgi:uncharacterized protein involved in type VI secretion and phage assembly
MASLADMIKKTATVDKYGSNAQSTQSGVNIAIVTNNKDEEDRYRVKVQYPWMDSKVESHWARISTLMAGKEIGAVWLPEVGDEVLVSWIDGDMEQPVIIGHLWNGTNKSPRDLDYSPDDVNEPVPNNGQSGKNDHRFIRSRMKHHLLFQDREGEGMISLRTKKKHELALDDKDGAEKIRLYDMDRKQWLEIDVPAKKITMQTDTGDILIKAKKKIIMDCEDMEVKASKSIKVESGTTSEWKAGSTLKWESSGTSDYKAGGTMTHKAPKIDLNP